MKERIKSSLTKEKKKARDFFQDLLVAVIVIFIVGGMLVYAHFDIVSIVEG
tara:strand:+ start:455 stop:607 length:153 start_codon:yes stop_codon:yes gene_type:complete